MSEEEGAPLESVMHLKPWSQVYSAACGCCVERTTDGGVSVRMCVDHAHGWKRTHAKLFDRRKLERGMAACAHGKPTLTCVACMGERA